MIPNPQAAARSLGGLALGDAFGGSWFLKDPQDLVRRRPPAGPWRWTDDTAMALSIHRHLHDRGEIVQDELAVAFGSAYAADPHRNYGASMHDVLRAIADGEHWSDVTARQFGGQGSWGNGAAMRVAPLGAWFADDLDEVVRQAALSAAVTHAHPEASAGAIAVAVATALVVRATTTDLIARVLEWTPESEVATRLRRVAAHPVGTSPRDVADDVGSGALISAPDTVPFAIWSAYASEGDLVEALWRTAGAGGDVDTTCAIVGGILAARTGKSGVPDLWIESCEPLPDDQQVE